MHAQAAALSNAAHALHNTDSSAQTQNANVVHKERHSQKRQAHRSRQTEPHLALPPGPFHCEPRVLFCCRPGYRRHPGARRPSMPRMPSGRALLVRPACELVRHELAPSAASAPHRAAASRMHDAVGGWVGAPQTGLFSMREMYLS